MEVRFHTDKIVLLERSKPIAKFDASSQLYSLLFLRKPPVLGMENKINKDVLKNYKEILELTNAPYEKYDKSLGLRETRWPKYIRIIKPLILGKKLGAGIRKTSKLSLLLPTKKQLTCKSPEYIYWNKAKELVDRLRLLWSSKQAGHTGHDNEIMSIIEELREEGIIY